MSYTLIDHTGDLGIEVRAPTLEGVFAEAARALFEILAEAPDPGPLRREEIPLPAGPPDAALREFLADLLYRFCAERRMYVAFEAGTGTIRALSGAFDPARHRPRTEIKAVTWHGLEVAREGDGWKARVIFDV